MKRIRTILSLVLCVTMLLSLSLVFNGFADPGALNGESGKWANFDESVYDAVGWISDVKNDQFDWPSSGTVLLKESSSTYTLTGSSPNCIGITIPAGLKVDIYKYYQSAGMSELGYKLLGHFDTTNGKSVTIGKNTSSAGSTGNSGSTSTSKPSNSGTSSSTSGKKWGTVEKTFVPGTPSASYSNYYTDVPETFWAYHPIMTLTKGGLLAGYGNGKFGPNDTLTKEQLDIILTRLSNPDYPIYPSGNKETASRAYAVILLSEFMKRGGATLLTADETAIARSGGVSGGLLTNISSNGLIGSMWQGVYDNWRAGLAAGRSTDYIASIDEIPDAAAIRTWLENNWEELADWLNINNPATYASTHDRVIATCEEAICRAYNLRLVGGVDSKGTFAPGSPLTRAQLSQMLYNMGWTDGGCLGYF